MDPESDFDEVINEYPDEEYDDSSVIEGWKMHDLVEDIPSNLFR